MKIVCIKQRGGGEPGDEASTDIHKTNMSYISQSILQIQVVCNTICDQIWETLHMGNFVKIEIDASLTSSTLVCATLCCCYIILMMSCTKFSTESNLLHMESELFPVFGGPELQIRSRMVLGR